MNALSLCNIVSLLMIALMTSCDAWVGRQSATFVRRGTYRSQTSGENSPPSQKVTSVDVSDLGISMDQLYDPLDDNMSVESRGSSKSFS